MDNLRAQVILEIINRGSFRKAAESLGYTQAGVAYIVSSLEKEWDVKLFHREYGGVRMTEEGKLLLPFIQQISNLERQLTQKVNEINHLQAGQLRIVSFETIFVNLLPDILSVFQKDYPQVEFEFICCENRHEAARMVYDGDADLGFFVPPFSKGLETVFLTEEPMMAIISPEHPLANASCFPVSEIEHFPFIATKNDENSEFVEIFQQLGVQPHPSFKVESDYMNMAFVSKNLGFSIFSRMAAAHAPFNVLALPFDRPITRTIHLGVKSLENTSDLVRKFIEVTKVVISSD